MDIGLAILIGCVVSATAVSLKVLRSSISNGEGTLQRPVAGYLMAEHGMSYHNYHKHMFRSIYSVKAKGRFSMPIPINVITPALKLLSDKIDILTAWQLALRVIAHFPLNWLRLVRQLWSVMIKGRFILWE